MEDTFNVLKRTKCGPSLCLLYILLEYSVEMIGVFTQHVYGFLHNNKQPLRVLQTSHVGRYTIYQQNCLYFFVIFF
jgi:hypothetical protein